MKTPKVSVLIPTYNYARYLPEAVDSILAQDFEDYELLIIDDASTDDSAAVLEQLAARDSRIRCEVNSSNLGLAGNWNKCLTRARGVFIKYLFGDDRLASPQALGKMVQLLEAHPSAVLAVSARYLIDAQSRRVGLWDHWRPTGLQPGHSVIAHCLEQGRNLLGEPSVVLARKSAMDRGFNPDYRQLIDLEMWFHLFERGDLVYTCEALGEFRRHDAQQSAFNNEERVGQKEGRALLTKYLDKISLPVGIRRKALFRQIYWLRKGPVEEGDAAIHDRLLRQLGYPWFVMHWLRHCITKPFINIFESLRKRLRRRLLQNR